MTDQSPGRALVERCEKRFVWPNPATTIPTGFRAVLISDIDALVADVRREEREACAKVAETCEPAEAQIAAAIRGRGDD